LFLVFTLVKLGNNELLPSLPLLELNTFGDLYCALGNLSVKENIFLLNLIVLSIISFYSLVSGRFKLYVSSGKNFFINDSIIGRFNI
jgi:hypothetical protein